MMDQRIYDSQEWRELPRDGDEARFLDKVVVEDNGCWIWTANTTPGGYGLFWFDGIGRSAHRWAYERFKGPIEDGLVVCQTCSRTNCVNPDHLETRMRGEKRRRELCQRGHPLNGANLYVASNGKRYCRACRNENSREARKNGAGRPSGWTATRRRVLERDAYSCAVGRLFGLEHECSTILDVHHRLPRRNGGTNDDDNLYVLCRRHHPKIERMLRDIEEYGEIRERKKRWRRCPHTHRTREARESCERRLNRQLIAA